jgi:hypothetical protein
MLGEGFRMRRRRYALFELSGRDQSEIYTELTRLVMTADVRASVKDLHGCNFAR